MIGMTPRTGRPPSDNPHRHVVSVRLTDQEHATVKAAAEKAGVGIGPWMREQVVRAAKRRR